MLRTVLSVKGGCDLCLGSHRKTLKMLFNAEKQRQALDTTKNTLRACLNKKSSIHGGGSEARL